MTCIEVYKIEDYIHSAPGTIHDGNDTYIYVGRNWTYRIGRNDKSTIDTDETIYISYTGSSITNGVEFIGPTKAIIPSGQTYIDIEIYINVHDNAYGKYLYVSATSSTSISCNTAINQILSYKSTPYTPIELPNLDSCCEFLDKNYEIWNKSNDDKFYCEDFFYDTPMLY